MSARRPSKSPSRSSGGSARNGKNRKMPAPPTPEDQRLVEANERRQLWRKWGPYVSERQGGTVLEDSSADGDAWNYSPHDHARSRAYHWGEDGIGGLCDHRQHLCLSVALWN